MGSVYSSINSPASIQESVHSPVIGWMAVIALLRYDRERRAVIALRSRGSVSITTISRKSMSNGPNSLRPYQMPDNGLRQVPFSARNARWATGVGEAPFVDRKVHTHHTQQSHYIIRDVLRLIVCSSELFAAEMVLKHFLEIGLAHALLSATSWPVRFLPLFLLSSKRVWMPTSDDIHIFRDP